MPGPARSNLSSLARLSTLLPLFLACGAADSSKAERDDVAEPVDVNTEVNQCPTFAYSMVLPQALRPGEAATVVAFATDPDSDDTLLRYNWSATSGAFDEPDAAFALYRCAATGPQVLSVTTSDPNGCEKHLDFGISCASP
jgi:hypothetical protein